MRFFLTAIFLLVAVLSSLGDTKWTYSAEAAEEPGSTFYYFFESDGDAIRRVRAVWNGGAQNKPIVTDYVLGGRSIKIETMEGDRKSIPDLIAGGEADLELISSFEIACAHTGKMLVPPPPDKTLTDKQRIELYNLITFLALERKPHGKPAEQK